MKKFIQKMLVGPIIFISIMGFIYIMKAINNFFNSLSENVIMYIIGTSFVIFLLSVGFINDLIHPEKNGDQEKIYY
jgi:hypothetical protein